MEHGFSRRGGWSLGYAYAGGRGFPEEDKVQAYVWYNIAAANGSEKGKEWKAKVAEEMTKKQIGLIPYERAFRCATGQYSFN